MAMKTVISYVSGQGGDFVVNCCNRAWALPTRPSGAITPSASIKSLERRLGDHELLQEINNMPYTYVGSHSIDRLMRIAVRPLWLVVPNPADFSIWVARDVVTREPSNLVGRYGDLYNNIAELVNSDQLHTAAETFLSWLQDYNWTMMQMRLVQPNNQIDVSQLLTSGGIDSVIDQLPELEPVAPQCRQYHATWLNRQCPLTDAAWVIEHVASKLKQLVQEA